MPSSLPPYSQPHGAKRRTLTQDERVSWDRIWLELDSARLCPLSPIDNEDDWCTEGMHTRSHFRPAAAQNRGFTATYQILCLLNV